ncbi:MAG: TraR/DksA family transcriptional regulator [Acidimicrobiales bacterium]
MAGPAAKKTTKKAPVKAPVKKAPAKKAAAKAPAKKAPAKKAVAKAPAKKAAAAPAAKATPPSTKKAAPRKKVLTKSPFDKKFLDEQRDHLFEERATLAEQAESLRAEAESLTMDREPGDVQFDEESGEGDTLAVERDFDLARAAQARQTIEEIDAALERITKGVYGICEYSGESIPKERLKAIPWARERVEYKTRSFR